jgi:hypothetical protein
MRGSLPASSHLAKSTLCENFSQQKLNLPFVCTCQRTLPTTTGKETCGADRDRTDDIQLAKLALSQLSYSPGKPPCWLRVPHSPARWRRGNVVGLGGLEPPTSRLSGARSSQLSYRPRGLPRRKTLTASFILKEPSHVGLGPSKPNSKPEYCDRL